MPVPLNIHVRPVWRFRNKEQREFDQTLLTLLEAIERTGKLTEAARAARISHPTGEVSARRDTAPWQTLV